MKLRPVAGEMIVPVLAITCALYAFWEQKVGAFRPDTTLYMTVLIVSLVVLAVLVISGSMLGMWGNACESGSGEGDEIPGPATRRRSVRAALFICAAAGLVYGINWLGYLVAFSLFMMLLLMVMGVRPASRILIISACTVLVLHVLFVLLLGLQLPVGFVSELAKPS